MGADFGSIHVRTTDFDSVKQELEAITIGARRRFYLAPPIGGWITLFPNEGGQDFRVSEELARRLPALMLHCIVYDDDAFAYRL